MPPKDPFKQIVDVRSIVLLIFVIVICFAAGEFSLRTLEITDRMGFNRLPSAKERAQGADKGQAGQVRIVGIGDSFTVFRDLQGRNYLRYAQKRAAQNAADIDVVNLAIAGSDLHSYFLNISSYHRTLQPDIVTIGLYLGNDVGRGGSMSLEHAHNSGRLLEASSPVDKEIWASVLNFFKKSILLNYSIRVLKVYIPALRSTEYERMVNYLGSVHQKDSEFIQLRQSKVDPQLLNLAKSDAINPWDVGVALFTPNFYQELYHVSTEQAVQNLQNMLTDLEFMINWIRDRGMKPIVVLLHPGIVVGEKYKDYYQRLGIVVPERVSENFPLTNQISTFLDRNKVLYIDSLPALRDHEGNLYIENDIHLNSEGQRVVGDQLFRFLQANNLLTKK